jgi:hypothetical protein
MRALSAAEIEAAKEEVHAMENDYMNAPNRWNGPRGVADKDLTQSEAQALVAERARVGHVLGFAERKTLLNKLRGIK